MQETLQAMVRLTEQIRQRREELRRDFQQQQEENLEVPVTTLEVPRLGR